MPEAGNLAVNTGSSCIRTSHPDAGQTPPSPILRKDLREIPDESREDFANSEVSLYKMWAR